LFAQITRKDFGGYDFENKDFVVESFIGGTEHTIDSLVRDSEVILQIISDKLPMTPPYFIEMGDVMPSQLREEEQSKILKAVAQANALLGMRNGWTHTEVKLWHGEPYIIELAARMGGGYFQQMIQEVYGIDRIELLMSVMKGKDILPLGSPRKVVIGKRVVGYGVKYVYGYPRIRLFWGVLSFTSLLKRY
jgi:biotin carboxylase